MLGNVTAELLLGAVSPFIDAGNVPGAIVGFLRNNQTSLAAAGSTGLGGSPLTDDALMRISSNTKPMVAVLAELAHRRVLLRLDGPLEDTVPAECAVTVKDLLTMRLGFGFVFEADCAAVGAAAQAGLGIGPPRPLRSADARRLDRAVRQAPAAGAARHGVAVRRGLRRARRRRRPSLRRSPRRNPARPAV